MASKQERQNNRTEEGEENEEFADASTVLPDTVNTLNRRRSGIPVRALSSLLPQERQ